MGDMNDLFDFGDVVHSYGDAQALADGVLVDLPGSGVNVTFHGRRIERMSRALYEALRPFVEITDQPHQALTSMLHTKLRYAVDTASPGEQRDYLYELPGGGEQTIWLIRNELGSWTVMFRSDY
jgi:hypothetical protein